MATLFDDKMKKIISIACLVACAVGCQSNLASGDDPISPPVYRAWQVQQSYYALVEIIDAHLDPNFHRVSKTDVQRFLGSPNWGTVNQDTNRVWAYQGMGRHIPQQDKALFNFDANGALKTIEWISE